MIMQICLVVGVLELPGIDEMIEARITFDIRLIRHTANSLARPMK